MYIYDGSGDKKPLPTRHTVSVTSAGQLLCGQRDQMTVRKQGREDWSLYFCEAGSVTFDGSQVQAGQLWVYPPRAPQRYTVFSKDKTVYWYLHFTGSCLEDLLKQLGIPLLTPFEGATDLPALFRSIRDSASQDTPLGRLEAEYHTLRLLGRLVSQMPTPLEPSLKRVTDNMEHSFSLPYDAARYAELLHVSPSRFNHLFREVVGVPPHTYVTALRMSNARALLEDTDLAVNRIAEKCGYENPLYFAQAFRKHTGLSPTAYRAAHKA